MWVPPIAAKSPSRHVHCSGGYTQGSGWVFAGALLERLACGMTSSEYQPKESRLASCTHTTSEKRAGFGYGDLDSAGVWGQTGKGAPVATSANVNTCMPVNLGGAIRRKCQVASKILV